MATAFTSLATDNSMRTIGGVADAVVRKEFIMSIEMIEAEGDTLDLEALVDLLDEGWPIEAAIIAASM